MELRKDGFLYRFAYAWALQPPIYQTSVCKLFWRCVLSLFVGWPIAVPIAFLAGAKVPTRKGFRTWSKWPYLYGCDSPLGALALTFVIGLALWGMMIIPLILFGAMHFPGEKNPLLFFSFIFGMIGWLIALSVGFAFAVDTIKKNLRRKKSRAEQELRAENLLWAYLKAKKEKLCPMIKIV